MAPFYRGQFYLVSVKGELVFTDVCRCLMPPDVMTRLPPKKEEKKEKNTLCYLNLRVVSRLIEELLPFYCLDLPVSLQLALGHYHHHRQMDAFLLTDVQDRYSLVTQKVVPT